MLQARFSTKEVRALERALGLAAKDSKRILRYAITDGGRAAQREARAANEPLGHYGMARRVPGRINGRNSGALSYTIKALSPGASGLASWVSPSQLRKGGRPKSPIVARGAYRGSVYSPAGAFAAPRLNGQVFRRVNMRDPDSKIERLTGPGKAITFRSREVFDSATNAFAPRVFESAYLGLSRALSR